MHEKTVKHEVQAFGGFAGLYSTIFSLVLVNKSFIHWLGACIVALMNKNSGWMFIASSVK